MENTHIIILFIITCIIILYSNNIEQYTPPKIESLKYDIKEKKEKKEEEEEEEEEEEKKEEEKDNNCRYDTKYNIERHENTFKPEEYVNIYDSNFGGLLGTKLGIN